MERRAHGDVGVVTERHHAGGVGVAVQHGQFLHRSLRLRQLSLAAEGHQHGCGADSGIKHFDKTLLRSHVGIGEATEHLLLQGVTSHGLRLQHVIGDVIDHHFRFLAHAVGVDEVATEIHDGLAAPSHGQAVVIRNTGNDVSLNVFLTTVFKEGLHVLLVHHHAHTLLRLADGDLRAIEAFVFGTYRVKVNFKTVGQLADSHAHATGTEVIGLLDKAGDFGATEEVLDLAFLRRIALLHFGGTGVQ